MQLKQIRYNELMDLVTTKMLSSLTPENVVEETFSGSSLCASLLIDIRHVTNNRSSPPRVISRAAEIISSPGIRTSHRVQSQLREILEEAASGSRLNDFDAFAACFDKLIYSYPSKTT